MRDDIVQFAGDPGALLEDGAQCPLLGGGRDLFGEPGPVLTSSARHRAGDQRECEQYEAEHRERP
ncbi:hypothetical protein [Streptomyces sp. NPDC014685]|uniref:hypothetical protein n=1 Tax=Streptomyces sp. NPDC014685 TaxID=3364881 RepID=UPI0036FC0E26